MYIYILKIQEEANAPLPPMCRRPWVRERERGSARERETACMREWERERSKERERRQTDRERERENERKSETEWERKWERQRKRKKERVRETVRERDRRFALWLFLWWSPLDPLSFNKQPLSLTVCLPLKTEATLSPISPLLVAGLCSSGIAKTTRGSLVFIQLHDAFPGYPALSKPLSLSGSLAFCLRLYVCLRASPYLCLSVCVSGFGVIVIEGGAQNWTLLVLHHTTERDRNRQTNR